MNPTARRILVATAVVGAVGVATLSLKTLLWARREVNKEVTLAPGSGNPQLEKELFPGIYRVNFPEFPMKVMLMGKPQVLPWDISKLNAEVKLQADHMVFYYTKDEGFQSTVTGIWMTPIGLARTRDHETLAHFARDCMEDTVPNFQSFQVEGTEHPAVGLEYESTSTNGVQVWHSNIFISFQKGVVILAFATPSRKTAMGNALRMARSAQFP